LNGEPYRDSAELALTLLEKYDVAVVPGAPFGAPRHMRLSYATSMKTIEAGLARLADFFSAR
jgi:aspartate aminotransferase